MQSRCKELKTSLKKAEAEQENAKRVINCAYKAIKKSGQIADSLRVEITQL